MKKLLVLLSTSVSFSLPSLVLNDDPKDLNFSKLKVSKDGNRLIGYDANLYTVSNGTKEEIKYNGNDLIANDIAISDDGNKVLEWSKINNDQENTKIHLISFDGNKVSSIETIDNEYNESFASAYIEKVNNQYNYFLSSETGTMYNIVKNKVMPIVDTNKTIVIANNLFILNNKIYFEKIAEDNNNLYYYNTNTGYAEQVLFNKKEFVFKNYQINNNEIYFYDQNNVYSLDTTKDNTITKINNIDVNVNKFILFNNIKYFYNTANYLVDNNFIYEYQNNKFIKLNNVLANNIINFNNQFLITSDNLNDSVCKIDSQNKINKLEYKSSYGEYIDFTADYISKNDYGIYFGDNDLNLYTIANDEIAKSNYVNKINIKANYVIENNKNTYAFSKNDTKTEIYLLNDNKPTDLNIIGNDIENITLGKQKYTLLIDNNFNLFKLDKQNVMPINTATSQIKLSDIEDNIIISNAGIYFNNLLGNSDQSELYNWNYKNTL